MLITIRILILSLVVITINLVHKVFFIKHYDTWRNFQEKTQNNFVGVDNGTTNLIDYDSDGDLDAIYTGTSPVGDVEIYMNQSPTSQHGQN
jgi:hypothetical protein